MAILLHGAAGAQDANGQLPDTPQAQASTQASAGGGERAAMSPHSIPKDILEQQKAIWTSPVHIRERDLGLLLPLTLVTTIAFTTDHQTMNASALEDASLNSQATTASNGLVGGFVAAPVLIYGIGRLHHDDHAEETGLLGGEAMVDGLAVDEAIKLVTFRERPTTDNARGAFFQTSVGFDSSFPSRHSVVAWSSAAVIASEYPGLLTQITAYGLATGVSLTRVIGRQHFPSDVLVGSAVGWMIGRYVYRRHERALSGH